MVCLIDPSLPLEHLPSEESGGWLHSLWLHLLPADSSAGLPASTGLHWSTYIPSLPQTVPVFYHPSTTLMPEHRLEGSPRCELFWPALVSLRHPVRRIFNSCVQFLTLALLRCCPYKLPAPVGHLSTREGPYQQYLKTWGKRDLYVHLHRYCFKNKKDWA